MENWWKAVLLLVVSTAANAIPLERQRVQDDAISVAIDIYNEQQNTSSVYRHVEDDPWMDQPTYSVQLRFRIKETVCLKADEKRPEGCDFKKDGIVKDCTTSITAGKKVICETVRPTDIDNGQTQTDQGVKDTGKESITGKKKKSDNWFMTLLNKFLELIGIKEAAEDSEPFCFKCIFDIFSQ